MDVPNALLLFLSACHSAIDTQAGEMDGINHIAKWFLPGEFIAVIGTLWQAYEESALGIPAVFYAHLAKEWKLEPLKPEPDVFPGALHGAIGIWRYDGNMRKLTDWAIRTCFTG